jgi:HlyD family secretion protein
MKRYLWVIGIVLILGAAAFFYYQGQAQIAEEPVKESLKTSKVRRGDIIITASGVGAVVTQADIQIGFTTAGVIEEIYVKEGDVVQKGDVLAKLEMDPQLTLDLLTQQINLINEQENYNNLVDNLDVDLASASVNYLQAQSDLEDLLTDRASLNYRRCGDEYVLQYEADYNTALEILERLQDKFNLQYAPKDLSDPERLQVEADIASAQSKVDIAYASWQYCLTYPSQEEIALMDAKIKIKENEVIRWKDEVDTLQVGVDPQDIELNQAKVAQAEAKLKIAEDNINGLTLIAPIAGTIMNISAVPGQTIGNNTNIIRIADLTKPILEVYLDETDLDQLVVGYETEVVFDAFDINVFTGKVISITPELVKNGNVVYAHGLVELDPSSFGKPFNLPLGLNASVDVIGGRSENTLLIPIEALRPLGDGSYAVFVVENGTPTLRMVEVGLTDFTSAEILSGLKVGEEVTTGIVETVQ